MADSIENFLNNVASQLESKQVKVGFIDGATYTDGTPIAEVAAINEYGDPANHIPPRPFFRVAIGEHEDEWKDSIAKGLRAGFPVEQVLEGVGAVIANDVYLAIKAVDTPPLADFTLEKRRERGNDSIKPLQDTREMITNVKYEVSDIEST